MIFDGFGSPFGVPWGAPRLSLCLLPLVASALLCLCGSLVHTLALGPAWLCSIAAGIDTSAWLCDFTAVIDISAWLCGIAADIDASVWLCDFAMCIDTTAEWITTCAL